MRRKAVSKQEQLKIDYCIANYNNELDNLSFILSCPISVDDNKTFPEPAKAYTPNELLQLIKQYSRYRDVIEREILLKYVDYALDMIAEDSARPGIRHLASEIANLGRQNIIKLPAPAISGH